MFFSAILLSALALGVASVTPNGGDVVKCYDLNGNMPVAINKFCYGHPHIMLPSPYASTGLTYGGFRIAGYGYCKPAEYLPTDWCVTQLFHQCANSGPQHGLSTGSYMHGCQRLEITPV